MAASRGSIWRYARWATLVAASLGWLAGCSGESGGGLGAAAFASARRKTVEAARAKRPPNCPNCRSNAKVVPVQWGWPKRIDAKAHWGGFIQPKKAPTWYCELCHRFLPATKRT
ncbi:MAG: hypothetical protein U1A27_03990 [Phycisphaerae bacterium]